MHASLPERAHRIARIRTHIGHCLRAAYDADQTQPMPERIVRLLAQLDEPDTSAATNVSSMFLLTAKP
jgi:hypothetical protein